MTMYASSTLACGNALTLTLSIDLEFWEMFELRLGVYWVHKELWTKSNAVSSAKSAEAWQTSTSSRKRVSVTHHRNPQSMTLF